MVSWVLEVIWLFSCEVIPSENPHVGSWVYRHMHKKSKIWSYWAYWWGIKIYHTCTQPYTRCSLHQCLKGAQFVKRSENRYVSLYGSAAERKIWGLLHLKIKLKPQMMSVLQVLAQHSRAQQEKGTLFHWKTLYCLFRPAITSALSNGNVCLGGWFILMALLIEPGTNSFLYLLFPTLVYKVRSDVLVIFPAVLYWPTLP